MTPTPRPSPGRLTRALMLARAVMLWERAVGVWAPFLLGAGLIAVAGLWGLFDLAPPVVQTTVLAVVGLAALVLAVLAARRIRWPSLEDARQRVETDSRLAHAPLSALEDRPASGDTALWDLHRTQSTRAAAGVRVGRPKAGLAAADPYALRWALLLAAILGLWARGPEQAPGALRAFKPVVELASAFVGTISGKRSVTETRASK